MKYQYLLGLFFLALSSTSHGLDINGIPVSRSEVDLLSPVCRLILVERRGIHHGGGSGPLAEHRVIFEKPEYRMGANNPHLHHYCWSEIRQLRYFRAKTQFERNRLYTEIISDIDYVLENTERDWPYFHVMLLKQATMMNYHGRNDLSLKKIDEALTFKPDYDRAYALKSDIYVAKNDKKSAIQAALEGIEKSPNSTMLLKRLSKLGVPKETIEAGIVKSQR